MYLVGVFVNRLCVTHGKEDTVSVKVERGRVLGFVMVFLFGVRGVSFFRLTLLNGNGGVVHSVCKVRVHFRGVTQRVRVNRVFFTPHLQVLLYVKVGLGVGKMFGRGFGGLGHGVNERVV